MTFFYSPTSSEILEEYYTPYVLNIIFSLTTLIIIFISILGTYIVLIVFNRIVSHEEEHFKNAKATIYKIYITGFLLYNTVYIAYLLIVKDIWEGIQLNVASIVLFFFISSAIYKYLNFFKSLVNLISFSVLIFFINSLFALINLIRVLQN